jgi:hypothetical protein
VRDGVAQQQLLLLVGARAAHLSPPGRLRDLALCGTDHEHQDRCGSLVDVLVTEACGPAR